MRLAAVMVVSLAVTGGIGVGAAPSPPSRAECGDVVLQAKFPYPSSGYRLVLDTVSVPPRYVPQVYRSGSGPWPYFRKAGLIVRADRGPVRVSVAPRWRDRVAISWGSAGVVDDLVIARCSTKYEIRDRGADGRPKMGNAYTGGFHLRTRAACVPLVFRVGKRSETVRFGIGRRCLPG